jgi:hypothetical protein
MEIAYIATIASVKRLDHLGRNGSECCHPESVEWQRQSVELEADSPTGHLPELNLRLYNPQSHQWSFNFASSGDGTMNRFANGTR